ncbi:MAG: 4Fe-4S binding protein [Sporomusaceae bacterium]|nr:4Fe-4S binding protein [Sporomusaceae bacterium]
MAHVITDKCDKFGACKPACPVEAISEGESKFIINPNLCIDCGACAAVCPELAINPD